MLKKTVTSTISHGNVVRVSSTFEDGTEMVEEFDKVSELLTLRKVRRREQIALTAAGGASSLPSTLSGWSVEVGEDASVRREEQQQASTVGLRESAGTPVVVRVDSEAAYVWRIRNLPPPGDNYLVTAEPAADAPGGELVVRTSNKKYFKRLPVPDLARRGLLMDASRVSQRFENNTLVIEFLKPVAVREEEDVERRRRREGKGQGMVLG